MVKQAAHDSSDECSNHSGLNKDIYLLNTSPSAGIGRQCELKIRWFNIVNVQVVSWILIRLGILKYRFYAFKLDIFYYFNFFINKQQYYLYLNNIFKFSDTITDLNCTDVSIDDNLY